MTAADDPRPPLDESRLSAVLELTPDLTLELLSASPSSNEVAGDRARSGAPDGLLVVADHQTAGRGRMARGWDTPAGAAVTFSLLLRPTVPAGQWPWLPLLTGHTVAKALVALGYPAAVKWPNDVLIGDRKVAGILVERIDTESGPAAVVGVGINVSTTAEELPVPTATSLAIAKDAPPPDREVVLLGAVLAVREGYDAWQAGGAEAATRLAASYVGHCTTVGQDVRVELPGGSTLAGRAVDVDVEGRLVVDTPDGQRKVGAGDVIHVRAPGEAR